MKKVLFVLPHMLCGGVEKALLSLINEMPKKQYEISVYMVKAEGDFLDLIPDDVKSQELPLNEDIRDDLMAGGIKSSIKKHLKNFHIKKLFKVLCGVLRKNPLATLTCDFNELEEIKEKYDVAICFHIHMPFIARYVAEKVNADKKIAWIHNDFKMSGFDVVKISPFLDKYQHFFAVSEQLLDEFVFILPQYKDRISVAHNIISEKYIKSNLNGIKVSEYSQCDSDCVKLLTIGRLDKQKGYDLAIEVCSALKKKGYKIMWYVLGNGIEEARLKSMVKDYDIADSFVFLGIRVNPYPYLEQCDIYVQPSRHEGYGIAVAEARVLCKPIICTDFTGARDQLVNDVTGKIVQFDKMQLISVIEELIEEPKKCAKFSENLAKQTSDIETELYSILKYF